MVNKKAYLKTVEAIVALLIFFGVVLFSISMRQGEDASVPEDIELLQKTILNSVEHDDTYRTCVFDPTCTTLDNLFDIIPDNLNYNYTIDSLFFLEGEDMFVDGIIIANETGDTRTFNIYLWRK
jgi:hypothetical protein